MKFVAQDSVVSVYSGPSRLFLLLFLLTAGLASLLVVAAVLLLLRRRARLNTKIQEAKQEKEEPVKEYKVTKHIHMEYRVSQYGRYTPLPPIRPLSPHDCLPHPMKKIKRHMGGDKGLMGGDWRVIRDKI